MTTQIKNHNLDGSRQRFALGDSESLNRWIEVIKALKKYLNISLKDARDLADKLKAGVAT